MIETALRVSSAIQRFIHGETSGPFCSVAFCYGAVSREGDACAKHAGCWCCAHGWPPHAHMSVTEYRARL